MTIQEILDRLHTLDTVAIDAANALVDREVVIAAPSRHGTIATVVAVALAADQHGVQVSVQLQHRDNPVPFPELYNIEHVVLLKDDA